MNALQIFNYQEKAGQDNHEMGTVVCGDRRM